MRRTYTVVGIYADNDQRYATCVEAGSPAEAEATAHAQAHQENGGDVELIVAGVLEGDHPVIA